MKLTVIGFFEGSAFGSGEQPGVTLNRNLGVVSVADRLVVFEASRYRQQFRIIFYYFVPKRNERGRQMGHKFLCHLTYRMRSVA